MLSKDDKFAQVFFLLLSSCKSMYGCYNNNCKTCIVLISLKSSSSERCNKQNHVRLVIHGDRQNLSLEHGTAENLWWKYLCNKPTHSCVYVHAARFQTVNLLDKTKVWETQTNDHVMYG